MPTAHFSEIALTIYLDFLLGYSAYTDYKSQIIPIELVIVSYPLYLVHAICFWDINYFFINAISAALTFLLFYLNAKFLGGGGGDAILFPIIPFWCGMVCGWLIIAAGCLLNAVFYLLGKSVGCNRFCRKEIPVAPGVFVIYLLSQIFFWRF